jgi:hypothetical protein
MMIFWFGEREVDEWVMMGCFLGGFDEGDWMDLKFTDCACSLSGCCCSVFAVKGLDRVGGEIFLLLV